MADTAIAVTAGSGTNVDTRTEATNGNHRQVVVLGVFSTDVGYACSGGGGSATCRMLMGVGT